jgi:mRNA interferase HigB
MRIVKEKTLTEYCRLKKFKSAEESIKSWIYEVRFSNWESSSELKSRYNNASIISSKRVVSNIKGNKFRLIADIEYKIKVVFIVWFGTHSEYEKIDVKTVNYES